MSIWVWRLAAVTALVIPTGCSGAAFADRPPNYEGAVILTALTETRGLEQVGRVEVVGQRRLGALMKDFATRTAQLGGRIGSIDRISTTTGKETRLYPETFTCGSFPKLRTCFRSRERRADAVVLTLSGRAFR